MSKDKHVFLRLDIIPSQWDPILLRRCCLPCFVNAVDSDSFYFCCGLTTQLLVPSNIRQLSPAPIPQLGFVPRSSLYQTSVT